MLPLVGVGVQGIAITGPGIAGVAWVRTGAGVGSNVVLSHPLLLLVLVLVLLVAAVGGVNSWSWGFRIILVGGSGVGCLRRALNW
jgi:hypothetical protein